MKADRTAIFRQMTHFLQKELTYFQTIHQVRQELGQKNKQCV